VKKTRIKPQGTGLLIIPTWARFPICELLEARQLDLRERLDRPAALIKARDDTRVAARRIGIQLSEDNRQPF